MLFVDNTRLALIMLVLFDHAAVTYSGVGGWYYRDPVAPGPINQLLLVFLEGLCQSFFMGTLFALAGYYSALSLSRKGVLPFVIGRLTRLGAPTLFYMALINPLTVYYVANMENIRSKISFTGYYQRYVTDLHILSGTGPMWFALALLIFSLIYAGGAALLPANPRAQRRRLSARLITTLIALCAAGAFLVRLAQPIGTTVCNMQLGYFTQYVVLFVFGVAAHANDWLRTIDYRLGRRCLLAACAGIPVWAALLVYGASAEPDALLGGAHWQSMAYALWESFNGVCMTVGLIAVLREQWNAQSPLVATMSDSAFAVYIFHPPIMVALALSLAPFQAPALAKCLLLLALSLPSCFGAAWLIRRTPLLRALTRQ
jgi:hypothetical protein